MGTPVADVAHGTIRAESCLNGRPSGDKGPTFEGDKRWHDVG